MNDRLSLGLKWGVLLLLCAAVLWRAGLLWGKTSDARAVTAAVEDWKATQEEEKEAAATPPAAEGAPAPPDAQASAPPSGKRGSRGGRNRDKGDSKPATDDPYKDISDKLVFGPPRPGRPQPSLTAILGDAAIVDNAIVRVGDQAQDAKVVEITANSVKLERDGQTIELKLF